MHILAILMVLLLSSCQ
ncbi:lipoprotein (plasmid) [Vibrio campbellii]|uniref:Lipoprotein n=1 Tax=Vibrio campbellii TaxID=680 RepID=A0ABY5ILA7_9VIBR|nr:lipoprotein [Vibrio campbellii]